MPSKELLSCYTKAIHLKLRNPKVPNDILRQVFHINCIPPPVNNIPEKQKVIDETKK